jgi:hypothetical protein
VIKEESTAAGLDFGALRSAIEGKDPDALLSFYAEASELRIENAALPDGLAFELKGRAEIERYLRAVCDQEMTCLLEGEVISCEERITFGQRCTYPDGTRVVVKTTLEIVEGGIVRQTDVAHSTHREGTGEGVSTRSFS